jgi:alcohol dehydrogenase YqhD (iron-dependent ADH family)
MNTIMIMDATAKRADLEKKAVEREILKELEKKKMENDIQAMLEREIARAAKEIEKSTFTSFELTYWTKDIFTTKEEEIAREAIERLSTFLRKLGYVVNDFHEYTQSWKTRSGKFGYLFFRLPREGEE